MQYLRYHLTLDPQIWHLQFLKPRRGVTYIHTLAEDDRLNAIACMHACIHARQSGERSVLKLFNRSGPWSIAPILGQ